ncbi:MAG: hypothetical protein LPK45_07535 [Bacteroidota bacterium]|nr:hypothetical protein [Bacteroidota bacterium]MDX5430924.1 hypothetical protein [Bacteroidota bacterium]MDX5469672.1 hypothetical protein [Bacteroidota bacterium]
MLDAQPIKKEDLLKRKASSIKKYQVENALPNQYFLKMNFNDYRILNPEEFELYYGKQIERIELYYTNFQVSDSFEQGALNGKRLDELEKLIPNVYEQTGITWRFIGQNGAKKPEEAKSYFHGFVITFRDLPFIDRTSELLMMDSLSSALSTIKDTVAAIECKSISRTRKRWTGKYLPNNPKKLEAGIRYRRPGIFAKRKKEYMMTVKTTTICDTLWGITGTVPPIRYMVDSTVTQVLDRKMKDWKKAVVVTDVTGSMYPYVLQLQVWMRLNFHATDCRHFAFFNDGDTKMDRFKRIGKVGGIYLTKADNFTAMDLKCKEAMRGGGGGDGQENDIEAMLAAINKFPECKEIILIADNYAPVRDMVLLSRLNKPVHIILCGTQAGYINVEYLQIAHKTGGSIHTIEQDIDDLTKLSEGAELEISGHRYKIIKGKFELIRGT